MTSKIHVTKIDFESEYSPSSRTYISLFSIIPRYPQDRHRLEQAPRAGANHCVNRRESLRHIGRGAVPSCLLLELERLAGPRPRFAKALRPRLHGLQHRDLALLPPAIAPHPQVELVDAASVAGVAGGPRIGGPPGSAPLSTGTDRGWWVACCPSRSMAS